MNLFSEISARGYLDSTTHPELVSILNEKKICFYVGFDPSSDSFHLGQLAVFRLMALLQKAGHSPIAVIGGSTGSIGDPSGKDKERKLLSTEELEFNISKTKPQFEIFLDFHSKNKAQIVNNFDWMKDFSYLNFLRDYGKFFSVSNMVAKESIKRRLAGEGITYTEFSYMLLQAYDFYFLFKNYGCSLQLGGSDQWGNIVAGIDLIRRILSKQAYGMTMPLLVKSDGSKFGKSEQGALWLDSQKTSPFQMYQYLIRSEDKDVIQLLKLLSDTPLKEIHSLEKSHKENLHLREAQQILAENVVLALHGKEELEKVKKASEVFYGKSVTGLSDKIVSEIFEDVPSFEVSLDKLKLGWDIVEALVEIQAVASKGKARQLLAAGGIYLNNKRIDTVEKKISIEDKISESFIFVRKGKKDYYLIKIVQ